MHQSPPEAGLQHTEVRKHSKHRRPVGRRTIAESSDSDAEPRTDEPAESTGKTSDDDSDSEPNAATLAAQLAEEEQGLQVPEGNLVFNTVNCVDIWFPGPGKVPLLFLSSPEVCADYICLI